MYTYYQPFPMVPSTSWEDTNQTPKSYSSHTSSEGTAASIGNIFHQSTIIYRLCPPKSVAAYIIYYPGVGKYMVILQWINQFNNA